MKIETTRFGSLTVEPDARVYFPEGLLGFSAYREYVMVPGAPPGEGEPSLVAWLQSCQVPELAFAVCPADALVRDYCGSVLADRARPADLATIDLDGLDEDAEVYLIVHRHRKGLMANLRGPVVVNAAARLAKQLVLNDERVPLRYQVPAPAARREVVRQAS